MTFKSILKKIPLLGRLCKKTYIKKLGGGYEKLSREAVTDQRLIVFESYQGRNYSCSPKAIYEYMANSPDFKDHKFVWVFRDTEGHGKFPKNTVLVKYDSTESFEAYAKAGMWIVNSRLRSFIVPRDDQKYIQCWHGTPLKKIGCDVTAGNATSTLDEIKAEYTRDGQMITALISPCDYTTEKLASCFALSDGTKRIIQQGYPRNDALFNISQKNVEKIRKSLNIPEDKKVILYCPTFRDSGYDSSGYKLQGLFDIGSFMEKYGKFAVLLVRAHYFIEQNDISQLGDGVIDVSGYDDINDLYIISDMLITDYSSVFFDYANLNRPMVFYHSDAKEYEKDMRGFYMGTAMLPGFIVTEQAALEKTVGNILVDIKRGGDGLLRYKTALPAFNKRFNPMEDGKSAERTVKAILSL